MSFPRYPSYKDSGVEWLGQVPAHWEVKRLKHNLRLLTEKTDRRDHPVALENIAGWTGRFIPTETEFEGEGIAFDAGDILFGKLRPYLAKAYRAESPGEAVGDFHVMRPRPDIDGRFAQYQILNREFIAIVDGSTFGSKMPRASWEFVGGMKVTTPPLAEQTAIAAFLDRETGKIDELVAEQRRLMELLKEKRQAVISHAVTRGLNPAAPLKPSGIEWLGDVPAHWTVIKLGLVSTFKGGAGFPDDYQGQTDSEIPFFKVGDIVNSDESGVMRQANHTVTRETANELRAFVFTSGTIVFAKVGAALLLKRFRKLGQPSCIDNNMMGMTAGKSAAADFLLYVLPLLDFTLIVNPGAVPSINEGQISSQRIALPPMEEQAVIIEYLKTETAKFDTLTAEAQRAIDLLQERRTALISAAVTGQIDVRHWRESAGQASPTQSR